MLSEREIERAIVQQWERAAPALAAFRQQELRQLTEEETLRAAEELLDLVNYLPPKQGTSGLVEQQRLFALARP